MTSPAEGWRGLATRLCAQQRPPGLSVRGGFFSTMRIYPERELGLVAMGNTSVWDHLSLVDAVRGG